MALTVFPPLAPGCTLRDDAGRIYRLEVARGCWWLMSEYCYLVRTASPWQMCMVLTEMGLYRVCDGAGDACAVCAVR